MCGIAGFAGLEVADPESTCRTMLARIAHRGPDGEGTWHGDGATLGHRRLAVIDPAPTGHQPMSSRSGRFVLTYNGEIYDYRALRDGLDVEEAVPWRGGSDTEVLLESIERRGLESTLERVDGMFALALWDRERRELALARDRFGEKPLFYVRDAERVAFASEITALEACEPLALRVSRQAVAEQFQRGYVPAPLSIYETVSKLEPGAVLRWRAGDPGTPSRWWDLGRAAHAARGRTFDDRADAMRELEAALERSVRSRMVSDVPLGAFLSGGIDSSLVVALMQRAADRPVDTFSIGFDDPAFDESAHARAVASHLGTHHHERIVTADDALALVDELGSVFDEPFADASQLPTLLLCRLARERVTVALSGDGGDELFGGYKRYELTELLWRRMRRLPGRRAAGALLRRAPVVVLDRAFAPLSSVADRLSRSDAIGPKVRRLGTWMDVEDEAALYARARGRIAHPERYVPGADPAPSRIAFDERFAGRERYMHADLVDYLPDDILTKVDRAAMSASLETRVPLLHPDVLDAAWRFPGTAGRDENAGKSALRELLHRHVPPALVDRPKRGFGPPLARWLRGPLRDWANDLLATDRLRRQGLYDPGAIAELHRATLGGAGGDVSKLWNVLVLQSWLDAGPGRAARIR